MSNIPQLLTQALSLHQAGNLSDAQQLYQTILASDPRHADALKLLGTLHHQRGNQEEAIRLLDRSLKINPRQPDAYLNRGTIMQSIGQYSESLASYNKAIALEPTSAGAYYNRGVVLQAMKRYAEALASYDKALSLQPDNAAAHGNRGMILEELQRDEEALASYDKAIALQPNFAEAYNNKGSLLRKWRRYDEALAHLDKAISLNPHLVRAYYNRGNVFWERKQYSEAMDSFEHALAINPNDADSYIGRGHILRELDRFEDALENYEKAWALTPDNPSLTGDILYCKMFLCDWQGIDTLSDTLAAHIKNENPVPPLFTLMAPTIFSPAQQRKCARTFVKYTYPKSSSPLWKGEKYAHDKIRVAYVSADFREHALSYLMAGVVEHHDKSRFETRGISLKAESKSATGQRVKAAFDQFIDVSQKSDLEVAQLLRTLEIDIAIDLMGFTTNSRPGIFAARAAPLQINYLGYPATMGADYIDYIIADKFVIPPEYTKDYSEKIVYLPECYQANDDKRFMPTAKPLRANYNLPEESFVFCSFNNSYKITPVFFDIWMRLLGAVPDSVLWLLGSDTVQRNLRAEAEKRGVEPFRLIFAPRATYEEHLGRLQLADLFLDSLPFNAGTTASDALWTGLPLVTCAGQPFAGRMAGSLLSAIGLPELIANTLNEYERLALRLAPDPSALSVIRQKLAVNRIARPLFNTRRFTRHLESAYTQMHERLQSDAAPQNITVEIIPES